MTPQLPTISDISAERSVIGAALIEPDVLLSLALRPDDFFTAPHRHIWKAIVETHEANQPVDVVTVAHRLTQAKLLEAVGGPMFIGDIMAEAGTAVGAAHHAGIVSELSRKRAFIKAGTDIAARGYAPEVTADELQADAEASLFAVSQHHRQHADSLTRLTPVVGKVLTDLDECVKTGVVPGMPTGFDQLDRILNMHRTDLIIIAGRPGMGKTAFALALIDHFAKAFWGVKFSLEMSTEQLAKRMLSARAGVGLKELFTGTPTRETLKRLSEVAPELCGLQLYVDDRPAVGISYIRTTCRRLKMQEQLDFVVIDYLTLMAPGEGDRNDLRVSYNTKALKAMAKELDILVIVLSQLNRGLESRQDKRPMLSDLRESGAIEEDANAVVFLYRDEYYDPDTEDRGIGEVIVAKQRNGPTGTARLAWIAKRATFANLMASGGFN